jgi:small subunit ribosomal protein S17
MNNNDTENGKELIGIVVSELKDKTLVVETERLKKHRLYDKNYKVNKRIKANCTVERVAVGDRVVIKETRPISKCVHFKIISKVN